MTDPKWLCEDDEDGFGCVKRSSSTSVVRGATPRARVAASAVAAVRRPLEQKFQRQQNVAQRTRPRFLLAELQLHGRFTNLVLDDPVDPVNGALSRRQRGARTGVESPHVRPETARNQSLVLGSQGRPPLRSRSAGCATVVPGAGHLSRTIRMLPCLRLCVRSAKTSPSVLAGTCRWL